MSKDSLAVFNFIRNKFKFNGLPIIYDSVLFQLQIQSMTTKGILQKFSAVKIPPGKIHTVGRDAGRVWESASFDVTILTARSAA